MNAMSSTQSPFPGRTRGPSKKLTLAEIAELRRAHAEEKETSVLELCEHFGISKTTLYKYLSENPPALDSAGGSTQPEAESNVTTHIVPASRQKPKEVA